MSSEWVIQKLSNLGTFDRGKSKHRPRDDARLYGGPYPFIQTGDVTAAGGRITSFRQTYTEAGLAQSKLWPAGTLCITIAANIAETAILTFPACFPDSVVGFTAHPQKSDVRFVEYLFRAFRDSVKRRAYGSVQENINLEVLRSLEFPIPHLQLQVQIADYLTLIDDRIALLRETNATLEAIAQALFKSWFVDFDPVRAKQQGQMPEGMDEATAALFPDSFEESELGLVPKGWRVGAIGDYAKLHKGSINPLQNPNCLFEHFSLPSFDSQQLPRYELGKEIKSNKTTIPMEAVLLSKLNPHIPRVWLPSKIGNNAICSTEFLVFVPNNGASREFVYCNFSNAKFQELLCQLVTGTSNSHQRVKPDGVSKITSIIPTASILEAFQLLSRPIFDRIGHNRTEAQTLASIRDTLLPRLISGQLRITEAEVTIEEVTA